jgi:hypothetical protein
MESPIQSQISDFGFEMLKCRICPFSKFRLGALIPRWRSADIGRDLSRTSWRDNECFSSKAGLKLDCDFSFTLAFSSSSSLRVGLNLLTAGLSTRSPAAATCGNSQRIYVFLDRAGGDAGWRGHQDSRQPEGFMSRCNSRNGGRQVSGYAGACCNRECPLYRL